MTTQEHKNELKRLMESFASQNGVGMHKVFTSLIDYMAGYLDITCRPVPGWNFNQSQNEEFAKMSVQVLLTASKGIATKGWIDVFGEFFMAYLGEKGRMGQCFTPESLSELLANIMTNGLNVQPEQRCGMFGLKHIVSDPACGSGRLVLAAVTNLQKLKGLKCYAVCEDNDLTCMKQEVVIYTVKDRFVLGDDIQSKVLAFAFGLAAEIERQMIRQRTKEGLMLRMKMGILLGRPPGTKSTKGKVLSNMEKNKQWILSSIENGLSRRLIARKLKVDRNTLCRYVYFWQTGKDYESYTVCQKTRRENQQPTYKDSPYKIVDLPRQQVWQMIERDMTIPQIAAELPQFTYEQVYDTIYRDDELNLLYRQHAQLKIKKRRY